MNRIPVVDLHEDISYYYANGNRADFPLDDFSRDVPGRHGDTPKFRRADVAIVFASIFCLQGTLSPRVSMRLAKKYGVPVYGRAFTPKGAHVTALEHMKLYYALQKLNKARIRIVRKKEDVEQSFRRPTGFLIALEGAYAIEDIDDVDLFYNMGLRSLELAWNFDSRYSATCMSKRDYGLTGEGEDLIQRCNELGVIVDLAHASRTTHIKVAEISKLPVINSHSNVRRLHDVPRNLDDSMLEAVKSNHGVVGAIFDTNMIGGDKGMKSLVNHMAYVNQTFGPDLLAIGTDYFGLPSGNAARGLEDIGQISKLFSSLRQAGLGDDDIQKIAHGNAIRVIRANARRWH